MTDIPNLETEEEEKEKEIEVTVDMIEPGVKELEMSFSVDGSMDDPCDVATDVFRAMKLADRSMV